jgi:nicotinate-nucleotide adenylyltransferase
MTSQPHNARIALYGGTFDPVHDGHLGVARRLSQLFALDEVLFIPAHVAPHKRRHAAPATPLHRYAMLALATQSERASASRRSNSTSRKSRTRWRRLRASRGDAGARFLFVMGADSWEEITTWREWERLLSIVAHVVVTRPGYELRRARHGGGARRIVD